jgi:hypothetical protein
MIIKILKNEKYINLNELIHLLFFNKIQQYE